MDRRPFTKDLDLTAVRSREDLAEILRILHARADSPSLRELGKWSLANCRPALAKTTIAEMLAGKRLPRKSVLLTFVEACGIPSGELEPWQRAWETIAPADIARPSLQAELRQLRQQAIAEAEIRATEIIAGAEAKAALMLSDAATQGTDQNLKQRMVQVWVAEERVKQALDEAETKARSIIAEAIEQAAEIREEAEEALRQARTELGKIKVEIVEQAARIKEASIASPTIGASVEQVSASGEAAETCITEQREWQTTPELQSVRDAYDTLVSLHRIDMERQIRLAGQRRDRPE